MAVSKSYVSLCHRYKTNSMIRHDLSRKKLCGYDLNHGIFIESALSHADLSGASLCGANLFNADLRDANLTEANLLGANLTGARLTDAIMNRVIVDENTAGYWPVCPMEGDFIGYKKVYFINCYNDDDDVPLIAQLMIPAKAKRSSATTRKCRCSEAKVLALYKLSKEKSPRLKACSAYNHRFIYEVGKTVTADSFDPNRWNECSHGIHFFMTFEEARIYL